jgi:hypothetical protein
MKLVPVRLESVWSCPVHAAVTRDAKGTCPICGRDLIQMTMALTWTCKGRPDIDVIEPGRCPDGSPMVAKRTLRPHGNHNPQHGGQFFMAPDNLHHLEGTLPASRLFRVYLYDDYARPLRAADARQVQGHVEVKGRAVPLVVSPARGWAEARIDGAALPAQMTAKLKFKQDAPEYRFDFTFPSVTKDPSVRSATPRAPEAAKTPASRQAPGVPASSPPPDAAAIDPALIKVPIPSTVPEILAQLRTRDEQVRALIDRGNLAAVFVPAFQARDLAIALEERVATLPDARRDAAAAGIADLVRTAWLLDAFGDVGNKEQVGAAYQEFHAAAAAIEGGFEAR